LGVHNPDIILDRDFSQMSWAFVDGNASNGINRDTGQSAIYPDLKSWGNKLYATWRESNGTAYQIRVAVYDPEASSPVWNWVDGGGTTGINYNSGFHADSSRLTPVNNKLYAIWSENYNGTYQIRVAVYNGNDAAPAWSMVDGNGATGLNRNTEQPAQWPHLQSFNQTLYAAWYEINGSQWQIRVAVYNGNDSAPTWSFVDGNGTNGINHNTGHHAYHPRLAVLNDKLYATWYENNTSASQIRVAVYNGNEAAPAWSFVDGNGTTGINHNTTNHAQWPHLLASSDKLYATWYESDGSHEQIRFAVYNGNDSTPAWTFVDGDADNGLNHNSGEHAYRPRLTVLNHKLLATWQEYNAGVYQIRAAFYNGDESSPQWKFVDGDTGNGLNYATNQTAEWPSPVSLNGSLYLAWHEHNGSAYQIRVAQGTVD
jgi:hypothetical protein